MKNCPTCQQSTTPETPYRSSAAPLGPVVIPSLISTLMMQVRLKEWLSTQSKKAIGMIGFNTRKAKAFVKGFLSLASFAGVITTFFVLPGYIGSWLLVKIGIDQQICLRVDNPDNCHSNWDWIVGFVALASIPALYWLYCLCLKLGDYDKHSTDY